LQQMFYTATTVHLDWLVHLNQKLSDAGTPDDGPQLSSALSSHNGFTVVGYNTAVLCNFTS